MFSSVSPLSSDCFFIKASAEGDAVVANVLASKTFSNDNDIGLTGAMPNRGAVTISPSTTQQTITAGYHNGSGYVIGDADLIAANIKTGVNIFGVDGSYTAKRYATGAGTPDGGTYILTVSGLAFTPSTVITRVASSVPDYYQRVYTSALSYNANPGLLQRGLLNSNSSFSASSYQSLFTINSDGFAVMVGYSATTEWIAFE